MASSNRHWPSMFKSKPHHHQWQHDINSPLLPSPCQRSSPFTSGCEERSPEPKPRWNPKPEQIRILEAIFNSGMVNPPRDEIRRIRAQLQEYGQVGDANVFYWFQNRKSRSKHKLRLLHSSKQTHPSAQQPPSSTSSAGPISAANSASPSSSSSSSSPKCAKSSLNNTQLPYKSKNANLSTNNVNLSLGSSVIQKGGTVSITNQTAVGVFQAGHHHHHIDFPGEPSFLFPVPAVTTGGCGFDNNTTVAPHLGFGSSGEIMSNVIQTNHETTTQEHVVGPCTSLLLSEMMNVNYGTNLSDKEHDEIMKMKMLQPQICYPSTNSNSPTASFTNLTVISPSPTSASVTVPSSDDQLQIQLQTVTAASTVGAEKVVVFINDMAFEVAAGPFNVKDAFGEDAVMINSLGQPLLTNEWGVSLQPLQHGASYYLI